MSPSRAQTSSLSSVVTSAARSNYRDVVLAREYNALLGSTDDFPDQLPKELVVALGSVRPVAVAHAASTITSAKDKQAMLAQEGTAQPSVDQLARRIYRLAKSRDASRSNEAWWNTAVWGRVYSDVMIDYPDLKVL